MKHAMIDFETLGKGLHGGTPAVCQVGACYFEPSTGTIGRKFFENIDADSHIRNGQGKIDADTTYWWLQQSEQARKSLLPNRKDFRIVMIDLNNFLADAKHIWSHATFDFVILTRCLNECGIKPSFSFRSAMDIRTLNYLAGSYASPRHAPRIGVHHNGLDDCIYQVGYVSQMINRVKMPEKPILELLPDNEPTDAD